MNSLPETSFITKGELFSNSSDWVNHSHQHQTVYPQNVSTLTKNEKYKSSLPRIFHFCQQERLLAEKDLQIEELLTEGRSIKGETSQIVLELQHQINQAIHKRMILFQEVECLKRQNKCFQRQIEQKDKIICALMERFCNSNLENLTIEEDILFHNQLINQQSKTNYEYIYAKLTKERQKNNKEKLELIQSTAQIQVRQFTPSNQKIKETNQQLLSMTNQSYFSKNSKELAITKFISQLQQQLGLTISIDKINNNTMTDIIDKIQKIKLDRKQLKQQKQRQINDINQLEKRIEILSLEGDKIKNINQQLSTNAQQLKSHLEISEEVISQLKQKLHKTIKDKQAKQIELFNIKLKIYENKNNLSRTLRNVTDSIKDDESEVQNKQSRLRLSLCTDDNCNFSKQIQNQRLNKRVDKLEISLQKRQKHIQFLQSVLYTQKKRSKKILQMATEFGNWFNQLGEDKVLQLSMMTCQKLKKLQTEEKMKEVSWKEQDVKVREMIE